MFLPLHGAHQATNAAAALAAVEALLGVDQGPLDGDVVRAAFADVDSPGRLEVVRRSPTVLVDAAHNPAGAEVLATALEESFAVSALIGVVGVLADKDAEGILAALEPVFDEVVLTASSSPRAMDVDDLAELARDIFGEERVHVAARARLGTRPRGRAGRVRRPGGGRRGGHRVDHRGGRRPSPCSGEADRRAAAMPDAAMLDAAMPDAADRRGRADDAAAAAGDGGLDPGARGPGGGPGRPGGQRRGHVAATTALLVHGLLAVACVAVAGLLRNRFGYVLGSALQLAVLATGLWVSVMFAIGWIFALLWVAALVVGRRVERERGPTSVR